MDQNLKKIPYKFLFYLYTLTLLFSPYNKIFSEDRNLSFAENPYVISSLLMGNETVVTGLTHFKNSFRFRYWGTGHNRPILSRAKCHWEIDFEFAQSKFTIMDIRPLRFYSPQTKNLIVDHIKNSPLEANTFLSPIHMVLEQNNTDQNCRKSFSFVNGRYLEMYDRAKLLNQQLKILAQPLSPQQLNNQPIETKSPDFNFDSITSLSSSHPNSFYVHVPSIPQAIREYCQQSQNCAVNIWSQPQILTFNRIGQNHIEKIIAEQSHLENELEDKERPTVISVINLSEVSANNRITNPWANFYRNWDFHLERERELRQATNLRFKNRMVYFIEAGKEKAILHRSEEEELNKKTQMANDKFERQREESKSNFQIQTPEHSAYYPQVYHQYEKIIDAEWTLDHSPFSFKEERHQLLSIAYFQTILGDESFLQDDSESGKFYFEQANFYLRQILDISLDLSGIGGTAKDILSLYSGKNIVTGEILSDQEKILIASFLVIPPPFKFISKNILQIKNVLSSQRVLTQLFKSSKKIFDIFDSSTATQFIEKFYDSARKLGLKSGDEIKDLTKISKTSAGESSELIAKNIDQYAEVARLGAGPKLTSSHIANFKNGKYFNRKLEQDEIFYRYHGENNRTGKKFVYITKNEYPNEDALRNGVAMLEEWGSITEKSKIKVPAGSWVSEGLAAPQKSITSSEIRLGGDYQALLTTPDIPVS